MTAGLSPTMAEALRRCRESGGLKYVRGGFWIEATADPRKVQASLAHDRPWSTTTHTIQALVRRGVVREIEHRDGHPIRVEST